jgi:hypothetical protein
MPILGIIDSAKTGNISTTAFNSIQTITVGSTPQSFIEFTAIPSTYTHLQIRVLHRGSYAQGYDNLKLEFNGDTGPNYFGHLMGFGDGVVNPAESYNYITSPNINNASMGWGAGASAASNTFGVLITDIVNYKSTTKRKTFKTLSGAAANGSTNYIAGMQTYAWNSLDPITSIKIYSGYGGTILQHSQYALYGINA